MAIPEMIELVGASAADDTDVRPALSLSAKLWLLGIALGVLLGAVDSWQSYYLGKVEIGRAHV